MGWLKNIMNCKYWTQEVGEIVSLIKELYKKEPVGGMLHIVLDDFNIDDDDLEWCIEYCNQEENRDRHDRDICIEIAQKMLKLSREARTLICYQWDKKFCNGNCEDCVITREEEEWY